MKGFEALELIFTLFVLIVVVLVIVRMFITKMSLGGIEKPIQDITDTYNYEAAYSTCNSLCSKYEADCSNVQNAVKFCLQKVNIDIDGNRIAGEKNHFNVVEGIPMCEDGIYCFHIKNDCACGSVRLDAGDCLDILCDYYQYTQSLSEDVAAQLIQRGIKYGTCEPNVAKWIGKIEDFEPLPVPEYTSIRDGKLVQNQLMGPDYWWARAGYIEPCGISVETGITLRCQEISNGIECTWSSCEGFPRSILVYKEQPPHFDERKDIGLSGTAQFEVNKIGTYQIIITCGNEPKLISFTF